MPFLPSAAAQFTWHEIMRPDVIGACED